MHRIAFVVVPPVYSFDLAIARMVLAAADVDGRAGYDTVICAAVPGRVDAVGGPDVVAEHDLASSADADTLIVLGGGGADTDPRVLAAVRAAAARGARIAGICTGAFVLAQAGVLDGHRATTHWGLTDELARRHPAVSVVPDALYVVDGVNDSVLTCAGAGASVELCLHLVRTDYGAAVANAAARLTVAAPPRPGAAAQVVQTPLPSAGVTSLAATREWALRRLDQPITLTDLAAHAGVSVRTLTRRFTAETGLSPLRWLLHRRVDRARQLLETTTLPMDQIAWHSGMGTADSLRQHMLRAVGVTPSAYRTSFTGKKGKGPQ